MKLTTIKKAAPRSPAISWHLLVAAAALLATLHPASALTWDTNGPTNVWTLTTGNANWTPGPVEWTDGNTAVFDNATGEAITITGTVSPTSVTVGANNGSWTFAGSGSITGSGGISKTGTGTLTILNANSYDGLTSLTTAGGVLNIQNANALGSTVGATNINAGSLQLQGGITVVGESLTVTNGGRLVNVSGTNEWNGSINPVTSGSGSRFQSDSGLLTVSGTVTLTGNAASFSVRGAGNGVVSGDIVEGGTASGLSKADAGTWTFSGANSYKGTTNVSTGTLLITGDSSAATGAVTVANGATLGGTGIVGGATTVSGGGIISAGDGGGADTLTFANGLSLSAGNSRAIFEAGDLIAVTGGTLGLASAWDLTISGPGYKNGGTTTLFTYTTAGTIFTNADITLTGLGFTPSGPLTLTSTGSAIVLNGISVVPEPSTWALLAFSLTTVMVLRRRTRNR
ncbi:MAG: autotransporter-associated beta strand repeat-containing protein [Terrimicrobiaceae bacterium]